MATIDDVEQAVCQTLAGFLFPGQTYQLLAQANCIASPTNAPGAPSITIPVVLALGTPTIEDVTANVGAGVSMICVTHLKGWSRNTTRFMPQRRKTSANAATLTAALSNGAITFGGISSKNQIVSVRAGFTFYAYLAGASDTPATVAAAIAAQIPTGQASGAVVTADDIRAVNVAAWQSGVFQVGTKEEVVQVIIFATPLPGATGEPDIANGYDVRAALGSCVNGLQRLLRPNGTFTQWVGLPDGTEARIRFSKEDDDDTPKRTNIWRRWVNYRVEYDEAIYENWPVLLAPLIAGNTNGERIMWFGPGAPVANLLTDGAGNLLTDKNSEPLGSMT